MNKYSIFKETDIICSHDENGIKHKPVRIIKLCKCGANIICPICGQGQSSSICKCSEGFIQNGY